MDFPTLKDEELQALEKEFVAFLIVNGIEGDRWKLINETNPKEAQELVKLFSQVVWKKIIDNTKYVKRFTSEERIVGELGEKEGVLFIGQLQDETWIYHKATKVWDNNRDDQVFTLLNQGFERCSEHDYNQIVFKN